MRRPRVTRRTSMHSGVDLRSDHPGAKKISSTAAAVHRMLSGSGSPLSLLLILLLARNWSRTSANEIAMSPCQKRVGVRALLPMLECRRWFCGNRNVIATAMLEELNVRGGASGQAAIHLPTNGNGNGDDEEHEYSSEDGAEGQESHDDVNPHEVKGKPQGGEIDSDDHDEHEDLENLVSGTDGDDGVLEASDREATGEGVSQEGANERARRPAAPLFAFPPGPKVDRTAAEESLQEVLPLQQRLVKYLTEDRVFGAQILCSIYFLTSTVAYWIDGEKFQGCYQTALMSLTIKQWGTVIGRIRRVLVPHLLYEPQSRYAKYRARIAALALDPAIQGIIFCGIFLLMPLSNALIPLFVKETVYMLWVIKEVLQIAAPGLIAALTSLLQGPLSVFMTAGDLSKWGRMSEKEKRLLLGRRLAQVCFKLEMLLPFSMALRILPGVVSATLGVSVVTGNIDGGKVVGEEASSAASTSTRGGIVGNFTQALPAINFLMLLLAYVKLLSVRNRQLADDIRILRGLKIRGTNVEWVEQLIDSMIFGKMVGCPWWVGLLASGFAILPNHEATKKIMASENKLRTFGMTMLNFAIGRTPGADDEDEEEDNEGDREDGAGERDSEGKDSAPTKLSKVAKVAAVASGLTDS